MKEYLTSPKVIGFLRGIGVACLTGILIYLGDAAHLAGIISDPIAALIAAGALAWEHKIEANGGGALFGAIK